MRIYVAAKFEETELVRHFYKILIRAGHIITFDWTRCELMGNGDKAVKEVAAVETCDAFIIIPHERGKGQYTELGVALASRKPVIVYDKVVSKAWNVFLHHPACRYVDSQEQLFQQLRSLEAT